MTSDTDFGELVYRVGQHHAGIILLRLDDERNANKIRVLRKLLKQRGGSIGYLVVVTERLCESGEHHKVLMKLKILSQLLRVRLGDWAGTAVLFAKRGNGSC